jgi:type IV pilus assembly protein PilW
MKNSIPASPNNVFLRPNTQSGFTLIELMISITIGLGILAALVGVLATNSGNSRTNDRTSELMTNGRYALNSMKQELRQAGFRGYTWAEPGTPGPLGVLSNECLEAGATAGSFIGNIRQAIWGAKAVNPFAANCIPAANYADGNDLLVVRRLDVIPTTTLSANTVYFQSSYAAGQLFRGATAPTLAGSPQPLGSFAVKTYVYYISPFTDSATESPMVPALRRVALQSDGSMASELVASGIERMEVQFGRTTTSGAVSSTQYLNTLSGTSYNSAVGSAWNDVNSVRIWLLARNATAEPGYTNGITYDMGDNPYTPNPPDGYRRQLFTTVVELRNGR